MRTPSNVLQSQLFQAAEQEDEARIQVLLDQNADPNSLNEDGKTLLHVAVERGCARTAARLLWNGARHDLADADGRCALSLDLISLELLHRIRQHYHRIRNTSAIDRDSVPEKISEQIVAWRNELSANGIVRIQGLIGKSELEAFRAGFSRFIQTLNHNILRRKTLHSHYDEEEHFWPEDRAYITNNAFKYSTELVRFCCRDDVLALARHYVGQQPIISRGVAMRYLPDEDKENDMFGWHHDMEEQRLKVFILLNDVGTDDQHMSYVRGSHRLLHPLEMYYRNPCSLEYCREQLGEIEIVNAVGQAGDVFLFDSNGAHRGNRKPNGAVRDVFFVEFTSDPSDVWGGDVPAQSFKDLVLSGPNPFDRLMAAEKKWNRSTVREVPEWVRNLPEVDRWLT